MVDVVVPAALAVLSTFCAAFWGHYFITKRSDKKSFKNVEDRVLILEQTMVREHNVRELVESSIKPIEKGIDKLLEQMAEMNKAMVEMQLDHARQQGKEEAKKQNTSSHNIP